MAINIKPAYRIAAAVVVAVALLVGSYLLGAAQPGSASTPAAPSGAGKITVTGTGTVTGTPDELILNMGVQANAGSVSAALQQANQAVNKVTAALEAGGVKAADIQTSGLSIQPNYQGNSQVPVGYGVSEQISVTLRALDKAGANISAAAAAGGNATVINGVSLNINNDGPLLRNARAAAVRDAKARATQFASALGRPLGAVVSVSDQTSYQIFNQNFKGADASAPSAMPVPISPGSQQITVQITVVYSIG